MTADFRRFGGFPGRSANQHDRFLLFCHWQAVQGRMTLRMQTGSDRIACLTVFGNARKKFRLRGYRKLSQAHPPRESIGARVASGIRFCKPSPFAAPEMSEHAHAHARTNGPHNRVQALYCTVCALCVWYCSRGQDLPVLPRVARDGVPSRLTFVKR